MITPFSFDVQLLELLNFDGGSVMDTVMWYASAKLTWVPLYAFVLWMVCRNYGWRKGLVWLVAAAVMVLFADQTCTFAKNFLPKFRPTHYLPLDPACFSDFFKFSDLANPDVSFAVGGLHTVREYVGGLYGTISSHAANSMGFAVLAWLTLTSSSLLPSGRVCLFPANSVRRRWLGWGSAVWVVLVCYSRIYLGVHYPMDILLGLLVGTFWGFGMYILFKKIISLNYEKGLD